MPGTYSNFPNGFPGGLVLRGMPLIQTHTGKAFWVSNAAATIVGNQITGSDGNSGSFNRPFATVDYAIGQCTASRGDIIFVKPGHAETLSAANAILADIAGVAIVGLGSGSLRPTFTLDTGASTTIGVTAANVAFKNCVFSANYADITAVFTTTTATFFTLEDCYFKATATNMNFLNIIDTDTTSNHMDGLHVSGCKWIEPDTATLSFVKMDGSNDDVVFKENFVHIGVNNNVSACFTVANGKIVTNLQILKNRVRRLNTDTATGALLYHTDGSTSTGIVADNYSQHADTAAELIVTASSGLSLFNNYSSGVNGNSGYIIATIDT